MNYSHLTAPYSGAAVSAGPSPAPLSIFVHEKKEHPPVRGHHYHLFYSFRRADLKNPLATRRLEYAFSPGRAAATQTSQTSREGGGSQ